MVSCKKVQMCCSSFCALLLFFVFLVEIRFLICPELIVGRLFCEELTDNEVIVMTGAERFCDYDGYGYESFCFRGNHIDLSPVEGSFRVSTVVAFDAQAYKKNNLKQQYSVSAFSRELNKAYVAFFPRIRRRQQTLCDGKLGRRSVSRQSASQVSDSEHGGRGGRKSPHVHYVGRRGFAKVVFVCFVLVKSLFLCKESC
jgi:hypothetical protein